MKTNCLYIISYNQTIFDYARKVKNETNFEQKFRNFHFALSPISVLLRQDNCGIALVQGKLYFGYVLVA